MFRKIVIMNNKAAAAAVAASYAAKLKDLSHNNGRVINDLTVLARNYQDHGPAIFKTIVQHISKVSFQSF